MKKEEEEMSRLLILNIGRKTQSDPHLDFSCFVCFGVAWKNIEVFYANNILFFLSSFTSTRPSTLSAWRKYLNVWVEFSTFSYFSYPPLTFLNTVLPDQLSKVILYVESLLVSLILFFSFSAALRNNEIILGSVIKFTNKLLSVTVISIKDYCNYHDAWERSHHLSSC